MHIKSPPRPDDTDPVDVVTKSDVEKLYRAYAARVRAYFRRHGATEQTAEDLTQETFYKVFANIARFRGQGHPAAWLWKIARNTLLDAARTQPKTELAWSEDGDAETGIADPDAEPDETAEAHNLRDCVRRGFRRLEAEQPERAACLRWVVNDGLSMEQIAHLIDRSIGATREYLSQCRKKLRDYLIHCREFVGT
jgi:RNA polymerase sigma-70 factor (ECF subfamily)